ncbi:hypothetical protein LTS18_005196 [Coniosporium uncinatum]|uniref:Uncharacterized protein n=1 Tax=Coniosporium uncinatum TaxID=93489 RepID=A0ACC3D579_9PEZI|nr:hypothetical protein LTS18_005196 [Coniosporium uncinatum]
MSPPQQTRQLSAIPDNESYSEDLFPASERSTGEWSSVKPDTASIASFVDSGLGVSFNSSNLAIPESRIKRSNPVPISGSLPATTSTRPKAIPSLSQIFKKRDLVSKSWSDLWDEDEEAEQNENDHGSDNMFMKSSSHLWDDDVTSNGTGRTTPRAGLTEMEDPATANNSRNRTPPVMVEDVSEYTGFVFEEHQHFQLPATPSTPRYSPPSKRSVLDRWAALGDRRRAPALSPVQTPAATSKMVRPSPSPLASSSRKKSRSSSWRKNDNGTWFHHGNESSSSSINNGRSKTQEFKDKVHGWNMSTNWRSQGNSSDENLTSSASTDEIEWVWRENLHL